MRAFALVLFILSPICAIAHDGPLPLGDRQYSSSARTGAVMSCQTWFWGGGAFRDGPWIRNGSWYPDEKPHVEGDIVWPAARFAVSVENGRRVIRANNLPSHATGEFPIRPGTQAFAYDRNPNAIQSREIVATLPILPTSVQTPICLPMGPIGVAVTGAAIFHALDAGGRDAPAHEILDKCEGHPERSGRYHYHNWTPCIPDPDGDAGRHSSLAGWMLDGFAIFGPKGDGGKPLTNANLDACHGHTHAVTIDGVRVVSYHYHFTAEFPYSAGCFRGNPFVLSD